MHFGVDTAVAFLAVFLVGLMFSYGIADIAVVAAVVGAIAAPFTRRAEQRALDARQEARGAAREDTQKEKP